MASVESPTGPPPKWSQMAREDLAVEAVEALVVDLEEVERGARGVGVDVATPVDLGEVAHALEQAVGDARGAAGALGDRARARGLDLDAQHARGADDDAGEVAGAVVLEPVLEAEAVAQRRGQQPGAGGGADQREGRELERDDARAGAGADRDRELAVLHRGIERLLDRAREPVDLVDEEHAARLERGQEGGDVGLALERGPGGLDEVDLELGGHDLGQRGLAEAGRAGEQHVVERVAAVAGGADGDLELALQRLLADELVEPARAEGDVELVLGAGDGRLDAVDAHRRDPGRPDRLAHRRDSLSAWAIRSSVVSPGGAVEQLVGLLGREAEADQAVAGEHPRVVAAGDHDRIVGGRGADLLAQLDHDPLGGALADALHGLEPRGVAGRDGGEQLARRAAREHGERDLRPDRLDPDEEQEQVALRLGGEAVEQQRVVTHDQVRVERGRLARRGDLPQRLGRDGEPVADAAAGEDDVVRAAGRRPRR